VTSICPDLRHVSARLELDVTSTADLVVAIAVAEGHDLGHECLTIELDGAVVTPQPIGAPHGGRLHGLRGVASGRLRIHYTASITATAEPIAVGDADWYEYIRPSRYCESDELGPMARSEFVGLHGFDLLAAVSSWVGSRIYYVPGSSRPIDGAVSTMLARSGVCRDFAHLTVALLRANGIPARVVAVYAPGLKPMDFHAVAEACVDDAWYVVDPTCMAPRASLVRIATGADAADTAFLTVVRGAVELREIEVTATVDPALAFDDITELVQLS
jgi:transglutaminase-like putative cysteine protease